MRHYPLPLLSVALAACLPACDGGATPGPGPASIEAVAPTHGDGLAGRELAAVLGCGACHPGAPAPGAARAEAPPLRDLGSRWRTEALAAYLEDPVPLREGRVARMPDFHLTADEAAAVAAFLLSGAAAGAPRAARGQRGAAPERGRAIVAALNCAGCHDGVGEPWSAGPPLAGAGERLRAGWLRDWLASPTAVRPAGHPAGSGSRMPDFRLSAAEADSLAAWLAPAAPPERPSSALTEFRMAKAEALVRERLACLGCHSLGGEGGSIGPALDGAAARLRAGYLERVVHEPGVVPGSIMPRPLEDSATLALVVEYLLQARTPAAGRYVSLLALDPGPVSAFAAGRGGGEPAERDGAALYRTYCGVCHGAGGAGDGFNALHLPATPTRHADAAHMATRPDATLFDGVHAGGRILGRSHRMPAFGGTLSAAEIRALVAHMRTLCDCTGPGWASP